MLARLAGRKRAGLQRHPTKTSGGKFWPSSVAPDFRSTFLSFIYVIAVYARCHIVLSLRLSAFDEWKVKKNERIRCGRRGTLNTQRQIDRFEC